MSAILKFEEPEPAPARGLIRLENITKTYDSGENEVQALRGVDCSIAAGEFVSIIGPSGSGKSTLMHILGCLDSPSAGQYWLDGEDVATIDPAPRITPRSWSIVRPKWSLMSRMPSMMDSKRIMVVMRYALCVMRYGARNE